MCDGHISGDIDHWTGTGEEKYEEHPPRLDTPPITDGFMKFVEKINPKKYCVDCSTPEKKIRLIRLQNRDRFCPKCKNKSRHRR